MERDKENHFPKRQGKSFKINLGHQDGPFLSKDISQTNEKSISLLAAKEILTGQQNTSQLLTTINKQHQNQAKMLKTANIQNFYSKMQFLKNEIEGIQRNMLRVKHEKVKLKHSIFDMKQKIEGQNSTLLQQNMPYLKKLSRLVKDQHSLQKGVFDDNNRQLQHLSNFRNKFLDQIIKCESQIINLQKFLGFTNPNQNQ